jgi:hypothetical protein
MTRFENQGLVWTLPHSVGWEPGDNANLPSYLLGNQSPETPRHGPSAFHQGDACTPGPILVVTNHISAPAPCPCGQKHLPCSISPRGQSRTTGRGPEIFLPFWYTIRVRKQGGAFALVTLAWQAGSRSRGAIAGIGVARECFSCPKAGDVDPKSKILFHVERRSLTSLV